MCFLQKLRTWEVDTKEVNTEKAVAFHIHKLFHDKSGSSLGKL